MMNDDDDIVKREKMHNQLNNDQFNFNKNCSKPSSSQKHPYLEKNKKTNQRRKIPECNMLICNKTELKTKNYYSENYNYSEHDDSVQYIRGKKIRLSKIPIGNSREDSIRSKDCQNIYSKDYNDLQKKVDYTKEFYFENNFRVRKRRATIFKEKEKHSDDKFRKTSIEAHRLKGVTT